MENNDGTLFIWCILHWKLRLHIQHTVSNEITFQNAHTCCQGTRPADIKPTTGKDESQLPILTSTPHYIDTNDDLLLQENGKVGRHIKDEYFDPHMKQESTPSRDHAQIWKRSRPADKRFVGWPFLHLHA